MKDKAEDACWYCRPSGARMAKLRASKKAGRGKKRAKGRKASR